MYDGGYWANTDEHGKKMLAQKIIGDILSETVGFAGCKMARRQLGVAHILEIESIEDEALKAEVETKVLRLARGMVARYGEIKNAKELKELIGSIK